MIDIHSHILPETDDGATTLADALDMARQAVAGGTSIMFATPHIANQRDFPGAVDIVRKVEALQTAVDAEGIPLRLVPGAEVYPMSDMLPALEANTPITLGKSKYLLLDSPFTELPYGFANFVFNLQIQGYRVILAHPERVQSVMANPQILEELVQHGLLLQVTASSLLGKNEGPSEEVAYTLLEHRWVHFVASDTHSPVYRRPSLAEAARELTDIMGADLATELLYTNGNRVLNNERVPTDPLPYTTPKRRKRWFGLFR